MTPTITDHAIIRYIERVQWISLDFVRNEIAKIVKPAVALGAASLAKDGFTFLLGDGVVITIIEGSPTGLRRKVRAAKKSPRMFREDT